MPDLADLSTLSTLCNYGKLEYKVADFIGIGHVLATATEVGSIGILADGLWYEVIQS